MLFIAGGVFLGLMLFKFRGVLFWMALIFALVFMHVHEQAATERAAAEAAKQTTIEQSHATVLPSVSPTEWSQDQSIGSSKKTK
jgi:hypothetical protein